MARGPRATHLLLAALLFAAARALRLGEAVVEEPLWQPCAANSSASSRWLAGPVAAGPLLQLWDGRLALLDREPPQQPATELAAVGDRVADRRSGRRWAVCVTGQFSRLEIQSKVTNLLSHLSNSGESADVFVVLEVGAHHFVNGRTDYGANSSACSRDAGTASDLRRRLSPWYRGGLFVQHEDFIDQLVLPQWRGYGNDKKDLDRRQRLSSHFSQWSHVAACEGLIRRHEEDAGVSFSDILRIREDAIVTLPFPYARVRRDGVAVKASQSWDGLNDKAMYASRRFLAPAFTAALELARTINAGKRTKAQFELTKRVHNPEQLLAAALRDLPVDKLPPEDMVMVDGRCKGPGRYFCLVPAHKDTPPPPTSGQLFAQPCEPEPPTPDPREWRKRRAARLAAADRERRKRGPARH